MTHFVRTLRTEKRRPLRTIQLAFSMALLAAVGAACAAQQTATEPTTSEAPSATSAEPTAPPTTSPPTTTAPSARAEDAAAALTAAGLPVGKVRDNTGFGKHAGVTKTITTDVASAYEFGTDTAAADRWMTGFKSYELWRSGTTVVRFAQGGSTPAYDIDAAGAALAKLGFVRVAT